MNGPTSNAIGSAGAYVTITRTIGAGKVDIVDATGSYVACLASSLTSFLISLDGQGSAFFTKGLTIRAARGQVFKNLIVDNTGNNAALTYTLAVGIGDITDSRLALPTTFPPQGDNFDPFVLGAQAWEFQANVGPTAAQYSAAGVFNPLASGVNGYIRKVRFRTSLADAAMAIGASSAQFSTVAAANTRNKFAGGAAPKLVPSVQTNAGGSNLQTFTYENINLPAGVTSKDDYTVQPAGAYVVPPGFGFAIWSGTVNTNLLFDFEWDEH